MAKRERQKTVVKKKSGVAGKIGCLLLGFVLGVVGTVGGVGGLGYYAVTQVKIKDAVGMVNDMAGLDLNYADYITEEYGDGTTLDLINGITQVVNELSGETGSLSTLESISPMVGKSVQSMLDKLTEFGLSVDYDTLMTTPFNGLGDFLTETVNGIEIAKLVESVTKNEVTGILSIICYGEEGEDYVINDDGTITMLSGATSATIGSLTNADMLSDRLSGLSFQTLMSALGSINEGDAIIRTLVYGIEGKDFVMIDDDSDPATPDVVHQLPKTYDLTVAPINPENPAEGTQPVVIAPDGSVFTPVDSTFANVELGQTIVLLDGESEYQAQVLDSESNVIYDLKYLETEGSVQKFQAYIDGVAQVRKGPYLSDVIGEGADLLAIVGEVRLGDLLGLNGDSDPIMLAVAYGEKDKDYTVDETTKKITPINDPVTINDLMTVDGGISIVEDIPLATLLKIESPLQEGVESLMIILAYGEEGTHYYTYWEDGVQKWDWLIDQETGEPYSERTVGYLMQNGNESLFNDLTLETLLAVGATSDDLMRALAYGNENTHYILVDNTPGDGDNTPNAVQMLPMRYFVADGKVYNEENVYVGAFGSAMENDIYAVTISAEKTQYVKANANGGYDVFATLEQAQTYAADNDTRMYHTKTKLVDLRGSSAATKIERIELAAALDVDIFGEGENAPDPLMVQLAFGVEGTHYTLNRATKTITWLEDGNGLKYHARTIHDMKDTHTLFESIYLDTVLELNHQSPAIMLALAYGNNYSISGTTIHYTTRRTLGALMGSDSKTLIESIEMRNIITNVAADDAMMNYILFNMTEPNPSDPAYKVRTLGDFMNGSSDIINGMMDELTLRQALGESATDGQLLSNFKDTKLSDLGTEIQNLTVAQAIGDKVTSHKILKHVADATLSDIDQKLTNLSIQQVLDDPANGIYQYANFGGVMKTAVQTGIDGNGNPIYKEVYATEKSTTSYKYLEWRYTDGNAIAPSPLKGTWRYLLLDENGTERVYALQDMNSAMGNVSVNIQKATLRDLGKDGIISMSDSLLDTAIITKIGTHPVGSAPAGKSKLGELTVNEAVNYLSTVLQVLIDAGLAS